MVSAPLKTALKGCVVLFFLMSAFSNAKAQEPPSDPNQPWSPPPPSETIGSSGLPMLINPPGTGGGAILGWMTDYQFNKKDSFSGSESMYLILQSPYTSYVVSWWEYYPAGYVPGGHWIFRPWVGRFAGGVAFGPMTAEPSEPYGQHAERLWLFDLRTWQRGETLVRWTYEKPRPEQLSTKLSLGVSTTQANPGQSITITASITPVPPGGTLTIQVSSMGGGWTTIQSGSATAGSLSAPWAVPNPGTYSFQTVYDGYFDSAANKQYLQTSSSTQTVTVQLVQTTLMLSASPTSSEVDALTGSAGTISVTGTLNPQVAGATVILIYSTPTGNSLKPVVVGPGGIFTDSFTPTRPGTYTVSAQYQGDQTHQPSTSQSVVVTVGQSWTTAIALGALVAAIVIGGAVVFLRRKRSR